MMQPLGAKGFRPPDHTGSPFPNLLSNPSFDKFDLIFWWNLTTGLLEDVSKSRSSSFEQTKPFDPSNGNGDFVGHGAPSSNSSGHKEQNNKHLQAHSPDLIPERGT